MAASEKQVRYSGFIARLVLKRFYRDQWIIPDAPPQLERFLRWSERRRMTIDTSSIAIDRPIFFLSMPRCGSSMLQVQTGDVVEVSVGSFDPVPAVIGVYPK